MAEKEINDWLSSNQSKLTKYYNLSDYVNYTNVTDITILDIHQTLLMARLKSQDGKTTNCQVAYFPTLTKIIDYVKCLDDTREILTQKDVSSLNPEETTILGNEIINFALARLVSANTCKPSDSQFISALLRVMSKDHKTGPFFQYLSSARAISLIFLSLITNDHTPIGSRGFVLSKLAPSARCAYIITTLHYYHSCLNKVLLLNLNKMVYGLNEGKFLQFVTHSHILEKLIPTFGDKPQVTQAMDKGKVIIEGVDPFNLTEIPEDQWQELAQQLPKTGSNEDESDFEEDHQSSDAADDEDQTRTAPTVEVVPEPTEPSKKQLKDDESTEERANLLINNGSTQSDLATTSSATSSKLENSIINPGSVHGKNPYQDEKDVKATGAISKTKYKYKLPDKETALTNVDVTVNDIVDVVIKRMVPLPGAPLLCIYKGDKLPENFDVNTMDYFLKTTQFPEDSILSFVNNKAMDKFCRGELKGFSPEKYKTLLRSGKQDEADKLLQIPERHMAMMLSDIVHRRRIDPFHFVLGEIEKTAYKNAISHYYDEFAQALTNDLRSHFHDMFADLKSDLFAEKISSGEMDPPGFSDTTKLHQEEIERTTRSLLQSNTSTQERPKPQPVMNEPRGGLTDAQIQAIIDQQDN